MFGQPKVENGHNAELNQVSNTSLSWTKWVSPHFGHTVGASSWHIISPQEQYQTGILCPHHSCLDIHQSWIFSIQLKYVFSNLSGTNFVSLFFTASNAGFAKDSIFTYHWFDIIGSTVVPHLSWHPTLWIWGFILTKNPCSSKSLTISRLASYLSRPLYFPPSSFIYPLSSITLIWSKLCLFPTS